MRRGMAQPCLTGVSDQSEVVLKHNIMLDLLASANALREFALASSLFPSLTGVIPCRRPAVTPPHPGKQSWENAVAFFVTSRCHPCAGTLRPKWGRRRPKVPKRCQKQVQKLTFRSPGRDFWVPWRRKLTDAKTSVFIMV